MPGSFFNRRLHSLLGIVPVGFFLIEHMITNYSATKGAKAFVGQVEWLWSLPFLEVMEVVFIFIPLLYHAFYGMYIAFIAKVNVIHYGTFRNVMFSLQRLTGVITLSFILWHLWETRVQKMLLNYTATDLTVHTGTLLQNRFHFYLYLIGILSTTFHFSNGIWSFLVSWGITVGPRAQLISTWVSAAIFFVISYIGIHSLIIFSKPEFIQQLTR